MPYNELSNPISRMLENHIGNICSDRQEAFQAAIPDLATETGKRLVVKLEYVSGYKPDIAEEVRISVRNWLER